MNHYWLTDNLGLRDRFSSETRLFAYAAWVKSQKGEVVEMTNPAGEVWDSESLAWKQR